MSLFDLIPTVGEVIDKAACIISDHSWVKIEDQHGNFLYYKCRDCGKEEK